MKKVWSHSKRASLKKEGKGKKKVTKSDVGGGLTAKKSDTTHSKTRDFATDVLFE